MLKWLLSILLLSLATPAAGGQGWAVIDDFEQGLDPRWEGKSFEGQTRYTVEATERGRVLRAQSEASASGLIFEMEYDPHGQPLLSWCWKVDNVLEKGDAATREGDDYAARVYVIFPHWFFPKTKTLNYIWANRLPQGRVVANPFVSNARMVAVRSGPEQAGQWLCEERNVVEDYRAIFGEDPPRVGAIAIMTDTDNTGEAATAWYDDIRIGRE